VVPELIDLVATHPRMARHFHIPLQSGSARILKAMYRPYSPQFYIDLLSRIRDRMPDAGLGADVMVGFPGETDNDFDATYQLVLRSPLTYLHVFPFSSRPETVAADLPQRIPDHVARFRGKLLRNLIAQKNEMFRRQLIGADIEVLTLDDGAAISSNFVRVSLPANIPKNRWVRVFVTGLTDGGLQASKITTAHETN
jgi:threonylcarbamoyladenosine tRNA methylthiotransferase MtaB